MLGVLLALGMAQGDAPRRVAGAASRAPAAVIEDGGRISTLDDLYPRTDKASPPAVPAATIEDGGRIATLKDLYPRKAPAVALTRTTGRTGARRSPLAVQPAEPPVAAVPPRPAPVVTISNPEAADAVRRVSRAPVVVLSPQEPAAIGTSVTAQ